MRRTAGEGGGGYGGKEGIGGRGAWQCEGRNREPQASDRILLVKVLLYNSTTTINSTRLWKLKIATVLVRGTGMLVVFFSPRCLRAYLFFTKNRRTADRNRIYMHVYMYGCLLVYSGSDRLGVNSKDVGQPQGLFLYCCFVLGVYPYAPVVYIRSIYTSYLFGSTLIRLKSRDN